MRAVPTAPGASFGHVTTEELAAADRELLWHPFTQQAGGSRRAAGRHRARRGQHALSTPTATRYIDGVSSLWCNVHGHRAPGDRRGRPRAARPRRALDDARPDAPAGDRARASGCVAHRAAGLDARLLLRQRLHRRRGRAEDGLPVLAAARRARSGPASSACATPTTATPSARSRSAGSSSSTRCSARCCSSAWPRPSPGDAAPTCARLLSRARRGEIAAVDRRAARAGRGRHARPPGGLPARACASCATSTASLLICDEVATGFGRTGTMFAVRAGGRRARPPVRRQGADRRLPAARGDARDARRSTSAFLGEHRGVQDVLPRPHLHRQPARLRRRARRRSRSSSPSARSRACSRKIARSRRCWPSSSRRSPPSREIRRCGFMVGIELERLRARGPHRPPGHARRARRGAIVRPLGDVVVLMPPLAISDGDLGASSRSPRRRSPRRPPGGSVDQRLVDELAQLGADRVGARGQQLGEEQRRDALDRVDPERGARRAAPRRSRRRCRAPVARTGSSHHREARGRSRRRRTASRRTAAGRPARGRAPPGRWLRPM